MGHACGPGVSQCSSLEAGEITQDGHIWGHILLTSPLQAVITMGRSSWCCNAFWHFNSQSPLTKTEY